jgi:hypothetical protein
MRRGTHRRRLAAAVILPLMLLASVAQAGVLYRCRVDGKTRHACCCPAKHQAERPAPIGPAARRAPCCDTAAGASVSLDPVVTAPDASDLTALVSAAVVVSPIVLPAPPVAEPPSPRANAPPRLGPPLLLVKSSRLI